MADSKAWTGDIVRGPAPLVTRDELDVRPWPTDRLVTLEELGRLGPETVVLDARNADRYACLADPVDPRAGHVPGAVNLPCRDHLQPDGTLRALGEIRARFEAVGVTAGTPVVSYCGSGVTACHNLLALELAGLGQGRLYVGSWSEYSRSDLPVATSDVPRARRP